ncbi:hypothetical protein FE257_002471 [Aspergillus nanangensis]|uniref:CRAL-TRIO domain-containing protein n=1 Tax=Aspergillus nanangensis TaxID=2582783 RepID=A0AAD4CSU2_ASPNN|nr:hypothetical protein FE257_002471 [Aspergillus nanangensis]
MAPISAESGYVGNLTADQEAKLRQLWSIILKLNEVGPFQDVSLENSQDSRPQSAQRRNSSLTKTLSNTSSNLPSDLNKTLMSVGIKQTELKAVCDGLNKVTIDEIRRSLLSTAKQDHPDALVLRFLRARKWDVSKSFGMMLEALIWRVKEQHVDEKVVSNSELLALHQSQNKQKPADAKAGETFLAQMRMGKCIMETKDKQGRPVGIVAARLHKPSEQSEEVIKRFILHVIESTRLLLVPPIESANILFDMTGFSLSNMEYAPVKFLIDCFQANYPESLGVMLIHNAPWVFSGIWKIIKGWMDPVIVSKVHFTYNAKDLEKHIDLANLPKNLGGTSDKEYKFVEPVEGENAMMEDTVTRDAIIAERAKIGEDLLKETGAWIDAVSENNPDKVAEVKKRRDAVIENMRLNYWKLDPYVRGRSQPDRLGMIQGGGKINFDGSPVAEVETKALEVEHIESAQANAVKA